eukprot:CAMPEP_0170240298 /NCGR_PEP_ID=MMETSP0116_2-20130129/19907_1 /TAXON_ID=400756 /ORGANISM="Durinskia baltica, Strain CSIRO CS-38" /LENGTH=219 /DNA_ID=CAMNT_0010491117 /DNA_START=54 /DNA_END=713 /DNA_ORIENTATION=+
MGTAESSLPTGCGGVSVRDDYEEPEPKARQSRRGAWDPVGGSWFPTPCCSAKVAEDPDMSPEKPSAYPHMPAIKLSNDEVPTAVPSREDDIVDIAKMSPISGDCWIRQLRVGAVVALDREPVHVAHDSELNCLEVREHDLLYPLAEMRTCTELAGAAVGAPEDCYELEVAFADLEVLLFQFDCAEQRAGFAEALGLLAAQAREAEAPAASQPDFADALH